MASTMHVQGQFERFVGEMRDTIPPTNYDEDATMVVDKLSTAISNVLSQPLNEKYRTIPLSNKTIAQVLEKHPNALKFMEIVGFQETGEGNKKNYSLKMGDENLDVLRAGLEVLSKYRDSLQSSTNGGFNPYQSQVTRFGNGPTSDGVNEKLEKKVAAMEAAREQKLMDAGIPEREIKITQRSTEAGQKVTSLPESYGKKVDQKLLTKLAGERRDSLKRESMFRTEAMRKLHELQNSTLRTKVVLKIQFPDGLVVQANFSPLEHLVDVEAEIKKCMHSSVQSKFRLTKRNKSEVLDSNATLKDLGLLPASRLFLVWQDQAPEGEYILDSLMNKQVPQNQKPKRSSLKFSSWAA